MRLSRGVKIVSAIVFLFSLVFSVIMALGPQGDWLFALVMVPVMFASLMIPIMVLWTIVNALFGKKKTKEASDN